MGGRSRPRVRGYIGPKEARFIELTLQVGSAVAKKQALQRLCQLLRAGFRSPTPLQTKGLVLQALSDGDPKVKRWAFNTLAQIGTIDDVGFIMPHLEAGRSDPDVFEAGLTALAHILPKDQLLPVLASWGVEMNHSTVLALAQQSADYAEELSGVRIDIEKAPPEELKAGTLLVGLQKAPDNVFSDYHPISNVIGALNCHNDHMVAQYSFWAATEHPLITIRDMRVPPKDFPTLPANVQGWALRLLAQDTTASRDNYDLIVAASESPDVAIREGLAIGLRNLFYDSLDTTVISWIFDEQEDRIRERLLEHMSAHAHLSSAYAEQAELAFRNVPPGSALRARLEAVCGCPQLSLTFRKIELQTNDPDLFAHLAGTTMNNTVNQTFNAQNVVGVSGSGTGNTGEVKIMSLGEAQARLSPLLDALTNRLGAAEAYPKAAEAKALIEQAKASPTKGNLQKLVDFLKLAKAGGDAIAGIISSADTVMGEIGQLLPNLPMDFG